VAVGDADGLGGAIGDGVVWSRDEDSVVAVTAGGAAGGGTGTAGDDDGSTGGTGLDAEVVALAGAVEAVRLRSRLAGGVPRPATLRAALVGPGAPVPRYAMARPPTPPTPTIPAATRLTTSVEPITRRPPGCSGTGWIDGSVMASVIGSVAPGPVATEPAAVTPAVGASAGRCHGVTRRLPVRRWAGA
jgi:hypothetical protein